jgi:DNA helicase-2/ATP-dependent DNA helicase PcrA
MTIHAAKGLEFDTVFLPAWEQGIFPNEMAIQDGGIEEERRLAYVAITRAKRRAVITHTMSRMTFCTRQNNAQSQFINEIDEVFVRGKPTVIPAKRPGQDPNRSSHSDTISMIGKLVTHPDLGNGVVIEENDGDLVTVAFKDRGIKRVARKFLIVS